MKVITLEKAIFLIQTALVAYAPPTKRAERLLNALEEHARHDSFDATRIRKKEGYSMNQPICKTCLYRVKGTRGYICEKTGKHIYWNQQTCPDYGETKQPNHKEAETP